MSFEFRLKLEFKNGLVSKFKIWSLIEIQNSKLIIQKTCPKKNLNSKM
jgi:hypothetical protein